MTQTHLVLIVIIEFLFAYLIAYSIKVLRKWTNKKIEECEELSSELPDFFRKIRRELRVFNYNLKKKYIPQPLTSMEISSLISEIGVNLLKLKMPMFSFNKKIAFITTLLKLWKIRHRITATFAQKFLRSAY